MLVFRILDIKLFVNYGDFQNTRFNGNSWASSKFLVCHFDPYEVYLINIDIGAILDPIVWKSCILHQILHFVNKQILWNVYHIVNQNVCSCLLSFEITTRASWRCLTRLQNPSRPCFLYDLIKPCMRTFITRGNTFQEC